MDEKTRTELETAAFRRLPVGNPLKNTVRDLTDA